MVDKRRKLKRYLIKFGKTKYTYNVSECVSLAFSKEELLTFMRKTNGKEYANAVNSIEQIPFSKHYKI